jgi:hypothetical protein
MPFTAQPSYRDMVATAAVNTCHGRPYHTAVVTIKKFIYDEFGITEDKNRFIMQAIKSFVDDGLFERMSGNRLRIMFSMSEFK